MKLAGYTKRGKTVDGHEIYKRDDEEGNRAYVTVNGYPRAARLCGMICDIGIAQKVSHRELID